MRRFRFALVALALTLGSCNQPQEIAAFAALADKATSEFAGVAHSVVSNCEVLMKTTREDAASVFAAETTGECGTSLKAEAALITAHKVIADYMGTLKLLASDNVLITQPADAAIDSLKGPIKLSGAQATALKGLTNVLSKALTDGYQRRELGKMIDIADEPLQAAVEAMSGVIGENIADDFDATADAIKSYYRAGLRGQDKGSIVSRMWIEQGENVLLALRAKKNATLSYRKILKSIADGHRKLKEANGNWKSAGLAQFLGETARAIQVEQKKVDQAFASGK